MARKDQRRGFLGFLVRRPGPLVVGIWVVLFLGSFGVAALVDLAEYQNDRVRWAQRRVEQLERRQGFRLDDLLGPDSNGAVPSAESDPRFRGLAEELIGGAESVFASYRERSGDSPPTSALDSARNNLERAVLAQQGMLAGLLGAGLGWLLVFVFVTVGTGRWVTARDGWVRVQSWHGGKLLMLYLPFTTAVVLYAFAWTIPVTDVAVAVLFVAGELLLFACAVMLVRATWNWFTGRETQRKTVGDGAGPEPPQVPRP